MPDSSRSSEVGPSSASLATATRSLALARSSCERPSRRASCKAVPPCERIPPMYIRKSGSADRPHLPGPEVSENGKTKAQSSGARRPRNDSAARRANISTGFILALESRTNATSSGASAGATNNSTVCLTPSSKTVKSSTLNGGTSEPRGSMTATCSKTRLTSAVKPVCGSCSWPAANPAHSNAIAHTPTTWCTALLDKRSFDIFSPVLGILQATFVARRPQCDTVKRT